MGEAKREHLKELIESFDTAMLITRHGDKLHARPMAIAGVEGPNTMWFATANGSAKVGELNDPRVSVTLQSKAKYVALSGTAAVVNDRAKVDQLWSPSWKVWFPDGKDDPSLVLIRVSVDDAEFWDATGLRGIRYAVNAARGLVRGEAPPEVEGQHERVKPVAEAPASRPH